MRPRAEPVPGAGPQVPVDQYGTGPFPRSLRIPGLGQRFVVRQELLFFGGDPERLVRGGQVVVGRLDWQTIWALRSAYDSPSAIPGGPTACRTTGASGSPRGSTSVAQHGSGVRGRAGCGKEPDWEARRSGDPMPRRLMPRERLAHERATLQRFGDEPWERRVAPGRVCGGGRSRSPRIVSSRSAASAQTCSPHRALRFAGWVSEVALPGGGLRYHSCLPAGRFQRVGPPSSASWPLLSRAAPCGRACGSGRDA